MTQLLLAEHSGVVRSTVQQLEFGRGQLRTLWRVLAALECEIAGRRLPPGETLGAQIAELRRRRGLSQRALASMLDIMPYTITKLETRLVGRFETLERVLVALGAGAAIQPVGTSGSFYVGVGNSSVHHGWQTPGELLSKLYRVFGQFDLDPCSPTASRRLAPVKARVHFTAEDDGLSLAWHGCVFVNPPYGRELKRWVAKAHRSVVEGDAKAVVALVPARTDTGWWHQHIAGHGDVFMLRGRLSFGADGQAAPFPSALVLWGGEPEKIEQLRLELPEAWHVGM